MRLGFLSSVELDDLGQALFSHGDENHSTWLINTKSVKTQLMNNPYRVLGMNLRGDVFVDFEHEDAHMFGVYISQKKDMTTYPGKRFNDYVIMNGQGDAVVPTINKNFDHDLQGRQQKIDLPIYYSKDGQTDEIASLGGEVFPIQLNDRGQVVGLV